MTPIPIDRGPTLVVVVAAVLVILGDGSGYARKSSSIGSSAVIWYLSMCTPA